MLAEPKGVHNAHRDVWKVVDMKHWSVDLKSEVFVCVCVCVCVCVYIWFNCIFSVWKMGYRVTKRLLVPALSLTLNGNLSD